MSVFVHAQGIKTVQAGGVGSKSGKNYVHVVVECPRISGITLERSHISHFKVKICIVVRHLKTYGFMLQSTKATSTVYLFGQ